jgi:hypothetical protein
MPRHALRFPPDVAAAVRAHVRSAVAAVDPARYKQEAPYTSALANRLEGVAYKGPSGEVIFKSTIVDDRGRNAAESRYGADLALTATVSDGSQSIEKVILVQAKLGDVACLDRNGEASLREQIEKMRMLVDAPKVMQIPERDGQRIPQMISGKRLLDGGEYSPMDLDDYFVARVLTTLDGCTKQSVVQQVQDSSLPRVGVKATMRK